MLMDLFNIYARIGLDSRQFDQGIAQAKSKGRSFSATMAVVSKDVDKSFLSNIESGLKMVKTISDIIKAHQTVGKAVNTAITFFTGLTTATKAQTAATIKLNTAMKANKIGLVIAGLVALTSAIVTFVRWTQRETEEQKALRIERERLIASTDELIGASQRSASAQKERIAAFEIENDVVNELITRFRYLYDADRSSMSVRAEMANVVDLLNASVTGLNLTYDTENDLLSKGYEAILRKVDAQQEQMKLAIAQERQFKLLTEQMQLERERIIIYEELKKAQEAFKVASEGHYGTAATMRAVFADYYDAIEELTCAYNRLDEQLDKNKTEMKYWTGFAVSAMKDFANTTEEVMQKVAEAMRNEAIAQAMDSLAGKYEAVRNAARQMFSAMSNETEMSLEEVESNLKNNIGVTTRWGEDIATLSKAAGEGLYQGFVDYLESLGIDSADKIRMFVQGLDNDPEGVHRIAELFKKSGEASIQALANAYGLDESVVREAAALADATATTLRQELEAAGFDNMGKKVVTSFANAIDEHNFLAADAVARMMSRAKGAAKKELDARSPSRVFQYFARMTVKGYADEISKKSVDAVKAIKAMMAKVAGATESTKIFTSIEDELPQLVTIFDASFLNITQIVVKHQTMMSRKAIDIIQRMMRQMDDFLRLEGFNTGRNFFRALGEGLISEEANLLHKALATAQAIRDSFKDDGSANLTSHAEDFSCLLPKSFASEYKHDNGRGGDTIIQHFHGVTEKATGYAAYRGYQKASLALGRS